MDVVFGCGHFHARFIESIVDAKPVLAEVHGPPRSASGSAPVVKSKHVEGLNLWMNS